MPDGVLQWIDRTAGEARIVRGGRMFTALTADVEPAARKPGARVHFDIRRRQGVETAVDVRLRPGVRGSHDQRHFGTLSGALRADTKGSALLPVNLVAIGEVDEGALIYAKDRIAKLAHLVDEPILFVRVKLTAEADPARTRPAIAQGALDVNGELVRAHVAAHEMREAIDLLERRLRDKLEHRAEHRESRRKGEAVPEPGEWRHGQLPTARPEYFDRPVEERELVRHKAFAVDELTPEEAVFDMEQLAYDFYLFADLASGGDSLVERVHDGSYRLAGLHGGALPGSSALPLGVVEAPAPTLSLDEALERINAGGETFVFFANAASGRGNVVYRRYDGHYGLITPAEPTAAS